MNGWGIWLALCYRLAHVHSYVLKALPELVVCIFSPEHRDSPAALMHTQASLCVPTLHQALQYV